MVRRATEEATEEIPELHPKSNDQLVGHAAQEQQLLRLCNENRLPHAIMLTGKRGIGKATLAYRLARFLLSPQEEAGRGLFGDALPPESLHIAATHPTFRRVVSGGHPDLLVLEGDDIKIDDARKVPEFLALTPAESQWRVVVIDSAEAMNRNAANALLKTLEEPPSQSVLILISHNPGALLPTIRSRCRVIKMAALSEAEFSRVFAKAAPQVEDREYGKWGLLSGMSPGVALQLVEGKADTLYEELMGMLSRSDTVRLHAFAERFARKDAEEEWQILKRLVFWLITRIAAVHAGAPNEVFAGETAMLQGMNAAKPAHFWTDVWERSGNLFHETENLYLDRKQAIITLIRGFV